MSAFDGIQLSFTVSFIQFSVSHSLERHLHLTFVGRNERTSNADLKLCRCSCGTRLFSWSSWWWFPVQPFSFLHALLLLLSFPYPKSSHSSLLVIAFFLSPFSPRSWLFCGKSFFSAEILLRERKEITDGGPDGGLSTFLSSTPGSSYLIFMSESLCPNERWQPVVKVLRHNQGKVEQVSTDRATSLYAWTSNFD